MLESQTRLRDKDVKPSKFTSFLQACPAWEAVSSRCPPEEAIALTGEGSMETTDHYHENQTYVPDRNPIGTLLLPRSGGASCVGGFSLFMLEEKLPSIIRERFTIRDSCEDCPVFVNRRVETIRSKSPSPNCSKSPRPARWKACSFLNCLHKPMQLLPSSREASSRWE